MRVFLDTNILVDVAQKRTPFYEKSSEVLLLCNGENHMAFISWHCFATLYYILERLGNSSKALAFLDDLISWVEIAPTGTDLARNAVRNPGNDLEDALQIQCAHAAGCACIVTRNPKDFIQADVPVYSPADFCSQVAGG